MIQTANNQDTHDTGAHLARAERIWAGDVLKTAEEALLVTFAAESDDDDE